MTPRSRSLATFLLASLAACSQPSPGDGARERDPARSPTEAERTAAKALSLQMSSALEMTTEPYQRSLQCLLAIDDISGPLNSSGALNAEQRRLVSTIRQYYASQSQELGQQAGKLREDVDRDLAQLKDNSPATRSGAIAAACLQRGSSAIR